MTTYFSKEDRLTHVVKSIDSHILKRAGTVLCRNSISDRPNYSSSTNFSSFKPSRTRGRRTVFYWRGSDPPLTYLACPPLHFLPHTSVPSCYFPCRGRCKPHRAAVHHLCTNSGNKWGGGGPEHAPAHQLQQQADVLHRRVLVRLKWFLKHTVKPSDF